MLISNSLFEYISTIGILLSFVGLIIGIVLDRKDISQVVKSAGFNKKDIVIGLAVVLIFIAVEIYLIKPTSLLFFDDAIYQGMALDLIHTGQAWMCNYGTPLQCFSGQIFHEPVGLSFNIAIAFLILGVKRSSGYIAEMALASISVFMTFMVSMLLLKDRSSAIFSSMILALTPVILVWAMPTNSDIAALAYSLIALFMLLVFIAKKNTLSLLNLFLSVSLLLYMKIDALIYIPIFAVAFIILVDKNMKKSLRTTCTMLKSSLLDTKFLVALLVFILLASPSVIFAFSNYSNDGFGYQGSQVPLSCSSQIKFITATGSINFENFKANICENLAFWINAYKSSYVIQPIYFSALAILGVGIMAWVGKRKELAVLVVWFGLLFFFYTAFYAGGVIFGVDWRFMISLIAPVAILGGFALGSVLGTATSYASKAFKFKSDFAHTVLYCLIGLVLISSLFCTVCGEAKLLSINPSQIQQAGDARFYENFVYNQSGSIPTNCIVYTYDPTLFNINNRTATQLSNIYNASFYANASSRYSCSVVDIGYWCYTPNNLCTNLNQYDFLIIAHSIT